MDLFKSQWERIQKQLAGLTPSQKMLTGTLLAIMIGTVWWWGHYAGTSEMEPVLDQAMNPDDVQRIAGQLTDKHIDYKIVGDRVLVSPERKFEALSMLTYNNVMPKDTASGFDEIIKQLSPWDGVSRENAMFNHGKELTLSRIISAFPDVQTAVVMIDPHADPRIGNPQQSTATVMIQMRAGARPGKQLVQAAASAVVGAQSGLAMKNVKVVVDGVPQRVTDGDSPDGMADADTLSQQRQAEEQRLTTKLADHLANIPGVLVSVTVAVDNKTVQRDSTSVSEKDSWHIEQRTETDNHDQTGSSSSAAGEAGAGPNIGLSVTQPNVAPSAAGSGNNDDHEKTEYTNIPGTTTTHTTIAAGEVTPVSASVRIPHSYFVSVARENNAGKDPTPAAIKETIEDERAKTVTTVMKTVGIKSADDVSVEVYADPLPLAPAIPVAASASVATAVGGHVKEIALGALAVLSLFMVSAMVRKSGGALSAPAAPLASATAPRVALGPGDLVAGEAAEGATLLNGMELDEESVRSQQMMEQVATLVEENPDAAATLIKRWMNR